METSPLAFSSFEIPLYFQKLHKDPLNISFLWQLAILIPFVHIFYELKINKFLLFWLHFASVYQCCSMHLVEFLHMEIILV